MSLEAAYKIIMDYIDHLDKSNKVSTVVETGVYSSQGKYYNVNPKHVHLTCKIRGGKYHVATNCKDKDASYYKNNRSNNSGNNKSNKIFTTNYNINTENNKYIPQGNDE